MKHALRTYCLLLLCAVFAQGCALIDDDLSVCGTDFELELQMQLVTNLDLELETTLSAQTDIYTRTILRNYFSHIFSDRAHDISIGFYSSNGEELVHSIHDVIDANQSTYTFYLPKNNYYAIALANLDENEVAILADSANSRLTRLITPPQDTLPTQRTGLFTVEREIYVQDTADQKIDLVLHMANSAFALVIDTASIPFDSMWAYLDGTSDGLIIRDSLYTYNKAKTVVMEEIKEEAQSAAGRRNSGTTELRMSAPQEETDSVRYYLFGCACFPSKDEPDGYGNYYEAKVYVKLLDGTITQTVLTLRQPLRAAELKIVRLVLQIDGSVEPTQGSEVGASVTLDWKEGTEFNPIII